MPSKPKNRQPKRIPVHCLHSNILDARSLKRFPGNPNIHSPEQIRLLSEILQANGWRHSIVVSARSGFITKGHCRLDAALALGKLSGDYSVPVEIQKYASEADEYADILADNKIAELSTLDVAGAGKLIAAIVEAEGCAMADFDASKLGFNDTDFAAILNWKQASESAIEHRAGKGSEAEEWGEICDHVRLNGVGPQLLLTFDTVERRDRFIANNKLHISSKTRNTWSAAVPTKKTNVTVDKEYV